VPLSGRQMAKVRAHHLERGRPAQHPPTRPCRCWFWVQTGPRAADDPVV